MALKISNSDALLTITDDVASMSLDSLDVGWLLLALDVFPLVVASGLPSAQVFFDYEGSRGDVELILDCDGVEVIHAFTDEYDTVRILESEFDNLRSVIDGGSL